MLILYTILLDLSDQLKLLHPTQKKMGLGFICLNHQEFILDTVAVQPEKEGKWLKLTFKKLILVKLLVNKLYSTSLKCTLLNYFKFNFNS
jgi:hypothetical protein